MLIKAESFRKGLPAPYVGGHVQMQVVEFNRVIRLIVYAQRYPMSTGVGI